MGGFNQLEGRRKAVFWDRPQERRRAHPGLPSRRLHRADAADPVQPVSAVLIGRPAALLKYSRFRFKPGVSLHGRSNFPARALSPERDHAHIRRRAGLCRAPGPDAGCPASIGELLYTGQQHLARRALLFIPCCLHADSLQPLKIESVVSLQYRCATPASFGLCIQVQWACSHGRLSNLN